MHVCSKFVAVWCSCRAPAWGFGRLILLVAIGNSGAEMASLMREDTDELNRLAKQSGIEPQ